MGKAEEVLFTSLGGGASIGGSAYLVRIGDTSVLIDFGVNPNESPRRTFDDLCIRARASGIVSSLTDVSAVVLTHAHMDHSGLLPALYRMFREEEKRLPPFYASKPTIELSRLVYDNILKFSPELPCRETDIAATLQHIRPPEDDGSIDWSRPWLGKLWFHPTSHLLGSAMVELDIEGRIVLHTGDLHLGETPTLYATKIPELTPDLLVVDGTYASSVPGRDLRDWKHTRQDIFALLDTAVKRRAIVLLPSFAFGRSQDILALVLEHADSQQHAEYYVYLDGQSRRVTQRIYPLFRHELSQHYLGLVDRYGSSLIKPVDPGVDLDQLINTEIIGYPAVVIASSGWLLPGSESRRWADAIRDIPNKILAFTGYVAEDIREEFHDRADREAQPWRETWHQLGCSSHASLADTESLVLQLKPKNVAIVHCGSGDLCGAGSLYARLVDHGLSVVIGREDRRIAVSDKGARMDDY